MVEGLVNKAFEGEDVMATRVAVTIAQGFVLTRRFGVTELGMGSWGAAILCLYS